jgi:hypothetical protein
VTVRGVLGVSLALVLLALAPSPVAACLCGSTSADPPIQGDVAFIGVVAARDDPVFPFGGDGGMGYGIHYTFAVEEVIKGDLDAFTVILTGHGGGDCGLPMAIGDRWRIHASWFEGELWSITCSGSELLDSGVPVPPVPGGVPLGGLAAVGAAMGIGAVVLVRRRRSRNRAAA